MVISSSIVSDGAESNDSSISLTFTSSEATSNFAEEDIVVGGGSLTNFASTSATVYTATFTPSDDGATTIDVDAGTYTDAYGNSNSAAAQFNWTYDGTSPTLTISSSDVSDGDTTNDSSIAVTFTSSEATSNFAAEDITVSGGTLSNFCKFELNRLHSDIYPSDDGTTSIDVSGNTFTDSVGNVNTASSQFNWTYDATRPSMTISKHGCW